MSHNAQYRYHYTAHGLHIASQIECPELFSLSSVPNNATTNHGRTPSAGALERVQPDVTIRLGRVPHTLTKPCEQAYFYQAVGDRFLLNIKSAARFLVTGGSTIVVEPAVDSHIDDVRVFLFGSAMGALLHQRNRLVLHGSAIAMDPNPDKREKMQNAVIFVGPRGIGKSTLAGTFHAEGYRILSDDICAITLDDTGRPLLYPGLSHIKLLEDAAHWLGHRLDDLRRVHPDYTKYALSLHDQYDTMPARVRAVYLLDRIEPERTDLATVEYRPVLRSEKLMTLLKNTYRANYLPDLAMQKEHFRLAASVAEQIEVGQIRRSHNNTTPPAIIENMQRIFDSL